MANKKLKPVYTVQAFDDKTASAVYSCLKTLCEDWDRLDHYSTVWKWLRKHDEPYEDAGLIIKRHILRRAKYQRKTK